MEPPPTTTPPSTSPWLLVTGDDDEMDENLTIDLSKPTSDITEYIGMLRAQCSQNIKLVCR